jgi:hypothetical protein
LAEGEDTMSTSLKYKDEVLSEIEGLPDEQITNLIKMIRLFKESIIRQKEYDLGLKTEFQEWDKLSDEAILDFERTL